MRSAEIDGVVRILVASGDPETRGSLREELENAGFDVCAEAATSADAVEAALRERPDVFLLDVGASADEAFRAAGDVKESLPQTKVVLLNAAAEEDAVRAAARIGADGYLPEGVHTDRLPEIIRAVVAGEAAYPRGLLAPLLGGLSATTNPERRSET
jgi:DNA-binding NarL/FixJ family response regulator